MQDEQANVPNSEPVVDETTVTLAFRSSSYHVRFGEDAIAWWGSIRKPIQPPQLTR